MNIPNSPPRLSLRLSTLDSVRLSIRGAVEPEAMQDGRPTDESADATIIVTSKSPPPESRPMSPSESLPLLPPARNPRRLSQRPAALLDMPKVEAPKDDKEEDEESTLYILQPRTYTPVPPSPQPSPRIVDEQPTRGAEARVARIGAPTSSLESVAQLKLEAAKPRVGQVLSKPQAHRATVIDIGARTDPKPNPRPSPRLDAQPVVRPDPAQAPELVPEPDPAPETHARQRTSLRERISLKTTPPESIQVPPPDDVELQRPSHHVPRACQAPDSAYGSDMERPPVNSMTSINSSLVDFTPPFARPGMIPSPLSEKQFFRPVQANPYSPLQQRPHTSGTVGPHHFPAPPRNTPSAMGMSIMSNGTTMTNQTGSGKTVKKKRSAFGWLKKAFSLDDEERAVFEQRKREQMANPYYQAKSQQFLDGKRIRQRPAY